jgi:hypothetical protein
VWDDHQLTKLGVVQLTNMTLGDYFEGFILKPANLTNTYYWTGDQGMEPTGIRKNVVSIPGYKTTFSNSTGMLTLSCHEQAMRMLKDSTPLPHMKCVEKPDRVQMSMCKA